MTSIRKIRPASEAVYEATFEESDLALLRGIVGALDEGPAVTPRTSKLRDKLAEVLPELSATAFRFLGGVHGFDEETIIAEVLTRDHHS